MGREMNRLAMERAVRSTPFLSPNALILMEKASDPDHDLHDLVALVHNDSVLTARLLRVVNSPAFKTLHAITTVDRAIAYLGERMVIGMAIADSAGSLFSRPLQGYECDHVALWKHDLFVAVAAREVAKYCKNEINLELAFTAGLLHDIGKPLVSEFLKGLAGTAVADIESGSCSDHLAAEQNLVGFDHADAGGELARHWHLPVPLEEIIRCHHGPCKAAAEVRSLAYAVHLGDIIAMMAGFGTGSDAMQYTLDQEYDRYFDISPVDLSEITIQSHEEFVRSESVFSQD